LVTHPRNRKDNPMNIIPEKTPSTAEWCGVEDAAGLLALRVAEWHDFGYAAPPAPHCKPIPPLGERSAEAIKAGHGAIEVIDEIIRDLYRLRDQLVTELRTNEDMRGRRPVSALAGTFKCCDAPIPWPARGRDEACPQCGTVWEHDGADIGAGARIKLDDRPGTKSGDYLDEHPDGGAPPAAGTPSSADALPAELGRLRQERQAWEETARACVCPPGLCSRRDFRDHTGETGPSGCMVCTDLGPEQPCHGAVLRGLHAQSGR
jgi:hypothetical protein